jgi:hypothetical protein
MKTIVALLTLALSSLVLAQPMMMDPSRMSGIPRPDPQVPAGTVTVRLIRGQLSNRMVGIDVALRDAAGKISVAKTDAEGRATFSGLAAGGAYVARARDGVEELTTQPIELPPSMGVRVMLVFKEAADRAADGVARPDKTIPAGTVVVRAVGDGGQAAAGVDVVLSHARKGEEGGKQYKSKTNGDGEARFSGLDSKPTSGYLAEVLIDGQRFASAPFQLQENLGSRVAIDVRSVSHDLSALHIGPGSHFIIEVTDDVVQVAEVLRLTNTSSSSIDPGPNGLHLPLPAKALSAQAGPQSPRGFKVNGHEAVLTGPIPPGDTELSISYALAYDAGAVDLVQRTPVAFDEFAMVSEPVEGMHVDGDGLRTEERELQGRKIILYRGPALAAGGTLSLHLGGLPHSDPTWRYLAAALAVALVLGFGAFAARGNPRRASQAALEAQREQLLGQLVALEQKGGDEDKRARKREELTQKLAHVYRALDEMGQ